ncbi:site-specific integrase [Tianweitania sp. BSSL-BM11]|uniref:Site-specific integrase n=1 Tax=Tianweitania aestuarii TaxID=2814886 RepID=A0ABS5RTL1_9HYPH|nr:site-specific integrase [Tianweitania aestuarii]MBS9719067.1 site-specific integrase [Tianweitania aestuarii]
MPLAIARPMKRPGTQNKQFVQRIPADVKTKTRGLKLAIPLGDKVIPVTISPTTPDIRLSLRTSDPAEAKLRTATITAYLARMWQSVRDGTRRLTHKEALALAGEIYREFVEAIEDDPGKPEMWAGVEVANIAATEGRFGRAALMISDDATIRQKSMEERFGFWADSKLATLGFLVDDDSRRRLIEETGKALQDAAMDLMRNADGDYGPDTRTQRFPTWTPPKPQQSTAASTAQSKTADGDKLITLFGKLAKERGYAPKTVSEWTRSVQSLTDHAKTEDASAITAEAIIAWMAMLVEKGRSAKTINETYFAAIKTIYRWARGKRYVPSAPTADVPKIHRREEGDGKRGFTKAEAETILGASLKETNPIRRWVPWLLAYSGARAGEVVQLRKEDVKQEPETGLWMMDFAPGAGRVKNKASRRVVPLHDHLIELGFVEWVKAQAAGRLFYEDREGGDEDGKRPRKSVAVNRLGDWIRGLNLEAVLSGEVSPNHGWRHRFSTELVNLDVSDTRRKRITGHRLDGQDNRYVGALEMQRLSEAVNRLPRYLSNVGNYAQSETTRDA